MARRFFGAVLFFAAVSAGVLGQSANAPLTDADVVKMVRSGLSDQTVVLEIRGKVTNFDTSPDELIWLKKAGVSQAVMDAMLAATAPAAGSTAAVQVTGSTLLKKALDAIAPQDGLFKLNALRCEANLMETVSGVQSAFEEVRVLQYPDRMALTVNGGNRPAARLILTPHFNYVSSDGLTRALGTASAQVYDEQLRFDPFYIARHQQDFALTVLGVSEQEGNATVDTLKISQGGADYLWKIDSTSGRLVSVQSRLRSGEVVTREYSDYRKVGDLVLPFKWRTLQPGRTVEATVNRYEIDPEIDESLFLRPDGIESSDAAVSFRVLDTKAVAHTQEMGGNVSVTCQLSQDVNTTVADPMDDVHFIEGTTPSNLQMTCNSWDTPKYWARKLNASVAVASDGNAYIVACDQGPKWSKCTPLEAGKIIHGVRNPEGIEVESRNENGKPVTVTYSVLQTRSLP